MIESLITERGEQNEKKNFNKKLGEIVLRIKKDNNEKISLIGAAIGNNTFYLIFTRTSLG